MQDLQVEHSPKPFSVRAGRSSMYEDGGASQHAAIHSISSLWDYTSGLLFAPKRPDDRYAIFSEIAFACVNRYR